MIYTKINESQFIDAFKSWDTYKDKFSYDGLKALYEYFEQLSDDTEQDIELDIVAIACEYTEYENFAEFKEQYPNIKDFEDLNNHTTVIKVDNAMKSNNFIIANF